MGDIMNTGSIHEYNEFLGIETLNPLWRSLTSAGSGS